MTNVSATVVRSVKGGVGLNTIKFLQYKLGPEGWAAFVAKLPPEARALCLHPKAATDWIPYGTWRFVSEAMFNDLSHGDEAEFLDLMGEMTNHAINGAYRFLIRFVKAEDAVKRFVSQFPLFNNTGKMTVEDLPTTLPNQIRLRVCVVDHAPWYCYALSVHSILRYCLKASRVREPTIERSEVRIGESGLACEFTLTYFRR